jgi:hypothetical protein
MSGNRVLIDTSVWFAYFTETHRLVSANASMH